MIDKLLNAKHWQIFTLSFGLIIIVQFVLMNVAFSSLSESDNAFPESLFSTLRFIPLISLIATAIYFSWLYAIAVGLNPLLEKELQLKLKRFRLSLFFPFLYLILISVFFLSIFSNGILGFVISPIFFFVFFVMHLTAMFCIFYAIYFVAKTIKTAELKQAVTFSNFAGEFFLLWFYPIGIWIIQPRVNKLSIERLHI